MSEATRENLLKAKNQVMQQVGYVQKGGKVDGKYSFAGEAHFIAAIRPHLVENGLSIRPVEQTVIRIEDLKVNNKNVRNVVVKTAWHLEHISGEYERIQSLGEANDYADKAIPKAQTIALKYALRQAFLIETGDDPDEEVIERQIEAKQHGAMGRLKERIENAKNKTELKKIREEISKFASSNNPAAFDDTQVDVLEAKIKAQELVI